MVNINFGDIEEQIYPDWENLKKYLGIDIEVKGLQAYALIEPRQFFDFTEMWREGDDSCLREAYIVQRVLSDKLGVEAETTSDRAILSEIEKKLELRVLGYD